MKAKRLFQLLPLVGLGILFSCSGKKQETAEEAKVKVKTVIAQVQNVEENFSYTATVKADAVNQITPALAGARIDKILVEVGNRVSKGQTLVQIDPATITQQKIQLKALTDDYARYSELLKVGGISQQTVDAVKTQIDILTTAIKTLEDNTTLKSPVDGYITARNYDNGDLFAQKPILTVEQLNPVKAVINVSEAFFTKVKRGMPVDITLDVYGDEVFAGKVNLVYPTIDASTHTFGVEIAINNTNLRVRPGMYARVTLNFGTHESIVVPDVAVQKQAGANDKYVFTVSSEGKAHYQKVELGQRLDTQYEILSGITPGQEVVTAGQTRLIEGTPVEIITN
ncbi:cation efflux system protein [Bacteroidia bacterium]|nr:cation efflux system protein [Bacteroidia bacterium]